MVSLFAANAGSQPPSPTPGSCPLQMTNSAQRVIPIMIGSQRNAELTLPMPRHAEGPPAVFGRVPSPAHRLSRHDREFKNGTASSGAAGHHEDCRHSCGSGLRSIHARSGGRHLVAFRAERGRREFGDCLRHCTARAVRDHPRDGVGLRCGDAADRQVSRGTRRASGSCRSSSSPSSLRSGGTASRPARAAAPWP
jgi:hypothetical protein